MGTSPNGTVSQLDPLLSDLGALQENRDGGEARLLLEAFQKFTQASTSLEIAYRQLQERTRRLSEKLAARNRELKKSLLEKEEAQNYLARILESLPCGVLVLSPDGETTLCNPVAAGILGRCEIPIAGKRKRARKNGSIRKYLEAVTGHGSNGGEVEIPFASGGRMRVLATSATSLSNAAGGVSGTLHIMRDVTEIKAMEALSKRGERLAAMGEMAVELAHEIRNPLGSIELFASLLENEFARETDAGRWAENIRIGTRSLNNIVSNMLHFANPPEPQFQAVDLHDLVREILRFAEPILKQREVAVAMQFEARTSSVHGDRELLKQMLLNLILNSLQAMPAQGSLVLGTRDVSVLPGRGQGGGIELTVQDTGFGIPPENLGRIFDPFFTTNKNGTGLGLSVVHQIIDQHSGCVRVESKVDQGTTFTIVLPDARQASDAEQ